MRTIMATAVLGLACAAAYGDVTLPAIFADHMVLQREAEVALWGSADPHEAVAIRGDWMDTDAKAEADDHGQWRARVRTPEAGGPHRLTITGKNRIDLGDVLIGEVWVCSGQSNMEWPLKAAERGTEEAAAAAHPEIRLFNVENAVAAAPRRDCRGTWAACAPESAGRFSAVGYFFARRLQQDLNVPIGMIEADWGGTPAEAWTSEQGLKGFPEFAGILAKLRAMGQPGGDAPMIRPNLPASLFNGMIAPIAGYGIRGTIWYQGEANVGRAEQYHRLFPAMIADWRRVWGVGDFPFYYVQIAPFNYQNDRGQAAELREAQTTALRTPNTGMAVTMDIGNPADIHPRDKADVGNRLALWALAKTYARSGTECSGPMYTGMTAEGGAVRLSFDHARGLAARGGELKHFQVAGADGKFVDAAAKIDGQTVLVSSPGVGAPAAVRYCWGAGDEGTLMNGAGLPAPSFRTDPSRAGK